MKLKENLVFLGMMGSGKSSIGLIVSKKLNIEFIDIDNEIEKKLGMSISKIFEDKGEKYFREIEEIITLKFLKKNNIIISLGGGAFLNSKIKKEVLDNHISFWLNWEIKTLVNKKTLVYREVHLTLSQMQKWLILLSKKGKNKSFVNVNLFL